MHGRRLKQYTEAAAPGDLAGIGARLMSFGHVPTGMLFQNLLADDPGAALLDGVTACSDAGTEKVGDTVARHLKFTQPEFHWELWVAAEGKPFVLKMRSERATDAGMMVTVETYRAWKVDQVPAKDTFTFVAPPDAKKVRMFTTGPSKDAQETKLNAHRKASPVKVPAPVRVDHLRMPLDHQRLDPRDGLQRVFPWSVGTWVRLPVGLDDRHQDHQGSHRYDL
jgi:hypothetical protein